MRACVCVWRIFSINISHNCASPGFFSSLQPASSSVVFWSRKIQSAFVTLPSRLHAAAGLHLLRKPIHLEDFYESIFLLFSFLLFLSCSWLTDAATAAVVVIIGARWEKSDPVRYAFEGQFFRCSELSYNHRRRICVNRSHFWKTRGAPFPLDFHILPEILM